jgi:hypothetical protein
LGRALRLAERKYHDRELGLIMTDTELAAEIFINLQKLVDQKYRFTNTQLDAAISLCLIQGLPESDHDLLKDVAESNGCPMWQAVLGQFRRCNENGLAFTPILDPGWQPGETVHVEDDICPECGQVFTPTILGQKYDKSVCGVAADQRARGQKPTNAALLQEV